MNGPSTPDDRTERAGPISFGFVLKPRRRAKEHRPGETGSEAGRTARNDIYRVGDVAE